MATEDCWLPAASCVVKFIGGVSASRSETDFSKVTL